MDFLKKLGKYMPEIEARLEAATDTDITVVEKEIGEVLPKNFKKLYAGYNGEKSEPYTGLFLGFSLMSVEDILDTMKSFREDDFSEIMSLTTGKICDEKMCDRIMVPFAWDGSRGYFCLDMSPDTQGKKAQVVALDYDYDECLLVADSIEEFYDFVLRMLDEKKCFLGRDDEEEQYFEFESGHFFNVMKELLKEEGNDNATVELPEVFWREYFNANETSVNNLQAVSKLMISNGEMKISLAPVAYMSKLRQLIIHSCTIEDFECIIGAEELKEIVLVNCTFDYEKLAELAKLSKLKEIRLRKMPITDICCLKDAKGLKILSLMSLEKLDITQLKNFTKLQELELEDVKLDDFEVLSSLKALKKLEFNKVNVPDLEFLQYLKKLTHFKLYSKVADEGGLRFLKELTQLKEFEYPVADMAFYAGCDKLEQIGIDAVGFQNPEVLKGSNITGVTVCHADSEEQAKAVIKRVKEQVKLYSYGMTGAFLQRD